MTSTSAFRKVDIRLHEKRNSNSHGARPVSQIISMIKWIRISKELFLRTGPTGAEPRGYARLFVGVVLRVRAWRVSMASSLARRERSPEASSVNVVDAICCDCGVKNDFAEM